MNWPEILQKLIDLKIPSIIIVGIFAFLSINLLKTNSTLNSLEGFSGLICLAVTILMGVYAFLEQIIKERYESIINFQQQAMKNLSETHSKFESYQQKSIETTKAISKQQEYTEIEEVTKTET